jgi:hypothetical protein
MDEAPEKEFSWGPVVVVAVVIGMIIFAFWAVQDKKRQKDREAILLTMDKELATDEQAVKDERRKLEGMTKNLEELRARIQYGQVKDGKAAVEEFNKKAAEQRAEREKFVQMADQYNQKVAKYQQLSQ